MSLSPGGKATVLVVEDDPALRAFYRNALTIAGYTVVAVEDGIDALRLAEDEAPDLVLLDLDLPRLRGHDVAAELKGRADTSAVPIVVVSGADTSGLAPRTFDCVMRKPVNAEHLIEAIERCLRSRR